MSPGFEYYIQNCRGPSIPTSILRQSSDHSIVAVLESNEGNQSLLKVSIVVFLTKIILRKFGTIFYYYFRACRILEVQGSACETTYPRRSTKWI